MRNKILAIAAIATAIGAPIAAQAQGTVGVVRGDSVIVDNGDGIAVEQRPAFRDGDRSAFQGMRHVRTRSPWGSARAPFSSAGDAGWTAARALGLPSQ